MAVIAPVALTPFFEQGVDEEVPIFVGPCGGAAMEMASSFVPSVDMITVRLRTRDVCAEISNVGWLFSATRVGLLG